MTDQFDDSGKQFNLELIKYSLDCFKNNHSVDKTIDRIFKRVGEFCQLSHISILEKSSHMHCFHVCEEWCIPSIEPIKNHIITYSEQFSTYFFHGDQEHYILMRSEVEQFDYSGQVKQYLIKNKTTLLLCLSIEISNHRKGMLVFETDRKIEEFTENEISIFMQVRDLLEQYVYKIQKLIECEKQLEQVTLYDTVTGLLKYDRFLEQAENIYQNDTTERKFLIFYADLLDFKYFNERYGYAAGDEILRMFEQHFMKNNEFNVLGTRLFSDYFIGMSVLDQNVTESTIVRYVEYQNQSFIKKVAKLYENMKISVVAGISIIEDKSQPINSYIDNANQARKQAKKQIKCCSLYSTAMAERKKKEVFLSTRAEAALRLKEFFFLLQPKVDLKTKKIIGAEALVRWKEPDLGVIPPDEFIRLFEETGFILKLDFYVYKMVCEYLQRRIKEQKPPICISVNVSRVHLNGTNFVKNVIQLVNQYNIPHSYLEFELTENVFFKNAPSAKMIMHQLKEAGFKVSMDDFGTGYSSLNLLTSLDFDLIKLDKGFLKEDAVSQKDRVVLQSIIKMAQMMGITVLCEGVERKDQVRELKKLSCDLAQGYLFGKPMLPEEFEKLICP